MLKLSDFEVELWDPKTANVNADPLSELSYSEKHFLCRMEELNGTPFDADKTARYIDGILARTQ